MALAALLKACRSTLRTYMPLENEMCRIMPGPRPAPSCGQKFYSIWALDWSPTDSDLNQGLDEVYSIAVTITYRAPYVPYDDQGEELFVGDLESMEADARRIIALLHQSYTLLNVANNLISHRASKLFEPLRFQNADATPSYVSGEWFGASGSNEAYAGLVQQVNFSGARIKQRTAEIDL